MSHLILSSGTTFSTRLHGRLAKIQISLRTESLNGPLWTANDPKRLQADSDNAQADPSLHWHNAVL